MWRLYDELIAGIPSGIAVSSYNIACRWTTVVAGGNTGVAHTTHGGGPGRLHRGPLTGMALRDAAALSKSWNFLEATLGVAALNAYYNSWDRVRALPGFEAPASRGTTSRAGRRRTPFTRSATRSRGKGWPSSGTSPTSRS